MKSQLDEKVCLKKLYVMQLTLGWNILLNCTYFIRCVSIPVHHFANFPYSCVCWKCVVAIYRDLFISKEVQVKEVRKALNNQVKEVGHKQKEITSIVSFL